MVSRISVAPSARPPLVNDPVKQRIPIVLHADRANQTKPVRQDRPWEPLFAGRLQNLTHLKQAFQKQATRLGVSLLSIEQAKKFLIEDLGFKRQGENFAGPHGIRVHIDRGTSHNHGDHLDITQKSKKRKILVDPTVRFE
jgi:hypothetical protein